MDGTVNQGTCLKLLGFTAGRGVRKRTPGQSVSPPAHSAVFPKTLFSDSLRSRRRELKTPSTLIIGGGIVGLATARQLLRQHPGAEVTVLEKEPAPGQHQTAHNSGVLHCGLYYTPGSLKARLAVEGIREMAEFCAEHKVPHEICGKLVVATNDAEVARMEKLFERGQANGLEGIEKLSRDQMREIEPHIGGLAALKVPQEGIVDYPAVVTAMVKEIEKMGAQVITRARVTKFHEGTEWAAETTAGDYSADWIINCAGLYCDRVSQLAGQKRDLRIVDHRPLAMAAQAGPVLPIYVAEPEFWAQPDASARQWAFAAEALGELGDALAALGQALCVMTGDVVSIFAQLHASHGIAAIWSHEETGNGWTYARDRAVTAWAKAAGIAWHEARQFGVIRRLKSRSGWAGA